MGNVVEIRVTSQNQARPGLVDARQDFDELRKVGVKAGDAVGASMQQMADKVTTAQARLLQAHNAEADALRQVQLAAAQVDFEKIGGDTDQVTAATKKLDAALRDVAKAQREIGAASKLANSAQAEFSKAGEEAGKKFVEGSRNMLGRIGPAGVTAVAPAATLIGAAAAEGIVLAFGAGLAGLGLAAASQFQHVEDEYQDLGDQIKAGSKRIFEPFGQAALEIRAQIGGAFEFFAPALSKASAELAPKVSHFTGMLAAALKKFEPAVEPLAKASGRVLDSLGSRMPGVIGKLERGFHDLADSIEENPEALSDLVDGMASAAEGMLKVFAIINKGYQPVRETVIWLAKLSDKIGELTDNPVPHKWFPDGEDAPPAIDATTEALDKNRQSTEELAQAQEKAAQAAREHADRLREVADAAYAQLGADIALREAIDQSDESLKDFNAAVRDHGASSEEASDALRDLESSALRVAEATVANALAQQRAAGQAEDQRAAQLNARDALLKMAETASGPARDAILKQADAVLVLINRLNAVDREFNARVSVTYQGTAPGGFQARSGRTGLAHGGISGAAGGGPRGRQTLVGEHGPEIVDLAPGSTVHPAGETQRMLAGGGDTYVVNLNCYGPIGSPAQLEDWLARALESLRRQNRITLRAV